MKRCFQVHSADNVATLLEDAQAELVAVVGGKDKQTVTLTESIRYTHKVALSPIQQGTPIVKFGIPIGIASQDILPGSWVHLHNCASQYDERSSSLDVDTGATTDVPYN